MIQVVLSFASFITGVAFAMQSAVNGALRKATENPIFASIASFTGGLLILPWLLILSHMSGLFTIPSIELLITETKWWMYIGGVFGVVLVLGSVLLTKKIGFTTYFSLLISGQLVGSVVADAIGFLGTEIIMPTPIRFAGILLLVIGTILIQR